MSTTPKALELADICDRHQWVPVMREIGPELRRQHGEIEGLRAQVAELTRPQIGASIEVQTFAIEVEKELCAALGIRWSAAGISITSLIERMRAQMAELSRWKSTNAQRIEALEGLLDDAQIVASKGREAIASLQSERQANAILTEENEGLRAQVEALTGERDKLLRDIKGGEPENGELFFMGYEELVDSLRAQVDQLKTLIADPQPSLTRPAVPEIDYDELIAACYRITKRPQGTPGCVHFKAGAEWFRSVMLAAAPLPEQVAPFQARVQPWLMECFGEMIAGDREERNHRFLEEALELVQACGCTASEAHQLVDYTFGRPIGEPAQEVGGVMVTLAALCLANRLDMHANGETELTRINAPEMVKKIRAKQVAKPKYSPLPEAAPQPEAAQPEPATTAPCKGMNCGCTDGLSHSMECQAEHAAAIAGGWFIKDAAVRAVGDA